MARSADSERISAELGLEAQQLRQRLATAIAEAEAANPDNSDNNNKTGGDPVAAAAAEPPQEQNLDGSSDDDPDPDINSSSAAAAASPSALEEENADTNTNTATAAAATMAMDDLKRDLERATSQLEAQASTLRQERERTSELEGRLSAEQALGEELRAESQALSSRAEGAERAEGEAMKAAATEAQRAAEVREEFEQVEGELVFLRGRVSEWEEEEARGAELKGTLETTRDALDELRCGVGLFFSFLLVPVRVYCIYIYEYIVHEYIYSFIHVRRYIYIYFFFFTTTISYLYFLWLGRRSGK